jgi:RimJ/RimL family protein N-acetyltransferase
MIGAIALSRSEGHNRGFWMGLPWRRAGLMTEAVEAVTDFWFGELGFDVLRAPKATANEASRRISVKTGMRFSHTGTLRYVSGEHPTEWWEITRAEWLLHRAERR